MKNNIEGQKNPGPSAATMDNYVKSLTGNIKTNGLEGSGWRYTGANNKDGSSESTVTLSRQEKQGNFVSQNIPFETFKSWQE